VFLTSVYVHLKYNKCGGITTTLRNGHKFQVPHLIIMPFLPSNWDQMQGFGKTVAVLKTFDLDMGTLLAGKSLLWLSQPRA
jgi:hypothetical protein